MKVFKNKADKSKNGIAHPELLLSASTQWIPDSARTGSHTHPTRDPPEKRPRGNECPYKKGQRSKMLPRLFLVSRMDLYSWARRPMKLERAQRLCEPHSVTVELLRVVLGRTHTSLIRSLPARWRTAFQLRHGNSQKLTGILSS